MLLLLFRMRKVATRLSAKFISFPRSVGRKDKSVSSLFIQGERTNERTPCLFYSSFPLFFPPSLCACIKYTKDDETRKQFGQKNSRVEQRRSLGLSFFLSSDEIWAFFSTRSSRSDPKRGKKKTWERKEKKENFFWKERYKLTETTLSLSKDN